MHQCLPGECQPPCSRAHDVKQDINLRTVNGKLVAIWSAFPDKEAIVFYDDNDEKVSLTNRQVRSLSEKCASLLRSCGVHKGDVVCNLLPGSMEREITNFGILLAGAVVMLGGNITERNPHFWEPIRQSRARYLIVDPSKDSPAWGMLKDDLEASNADIERSTNKEIPLVEKVFKFRIEHLIPASGRDSVKSAFDLIRQHEGTYSEKVYAHDPAAIYVCKCKQQKHYKLVLRNQYTLVQIGHRVEDMFGLHSQDIIYNDWPLSWISGLPFAYFTVGTTMVKSTLINCSAQKVVVHTWDLIVKEKCTVASLHPPMIQMLTSHCEDIPEPHWRLRLLTTTGFVSQSAMDAIGPVTESIAVCYSLIEAGIVSRLIVTAATATQYTEGCVGDMANTIRTKFDTSSKTAAKATKMGEILLQGKLVAKEYYNDPNLTKVAFTPDQFLLTGDLGFYDENNRLFVLGRKMDAIIRGDTAIFPRDIEEKVNQCPGIWKVKVVSIKDDKGIIQMCACVIPRSHDSLTIDRVKEFCRYQLGGTYDDDKNPHMPSYVFFFEDFPVLKGKVNRRMLAFMASEIIHGNPTFEY
ncbi:hypothetical protein BsWGS_19506 [Bradybaena similaris]